MIYVSYSHVLTRANIICRGCTVQISNVLLLCLLPRTKELKCEKVGGEPSSANALQALPASSEYDLESWLSHA